jgi:cell shape-determining protein MreC
MVEMAHKNSGFESEVEVLMSQIQALQNPPKAPVVQVKKFFREVTFEGEIQSLKAHLTEQQHLKAQVSEMPSL